MKSDGKEMSRVVFTKLAFWKKGAGIKPATPLRPLQVMGRSLYLLLLNTYARLLPSEAF